MDQFVQLTRSTYLTSSECLQTISPTNKTFHVPGVKPTNRNLNQHIARRCGIARILALSMQPDTGTMHYLVGTRLSFQFWENDGHTNHPASIWPRGNTTDNAIRRLMAAHGWGLCHIRATPLQAPPPYGVLTTLYMAIDRRGKPAATTTRPAGAVVINPIPFRQREEGSHGTPRAASHTQRRHKTWQKQP